MVKLKKYKALFQHFVISLTLIGIVSCSQQKFYVTKVEGKQINVNNSNAEVAVIDNYIKPYRNKIDSDLNATLAYAPQAIDKSGQWQSNIGSMLADATIQKGNPVFLTRQQKNIDICILNHGGIRSTIDKGNVTTRTAFEIMPFENSLIVMGLKGEQVLDLVSYMIKEKKPHPLSGLTFTIDKSNMPKNILVNAKTIELDKVYYVATSDYLANGGDNMNFFKKAVATYDLDYKLRNILIDYFKEIDTLPVVSDKRILVE